MRAASAPRSSPRSPSTWARGYAKSVREHAPQAVICIDNYHIVQLATKALDEVRCEHWNELRGAGERAAQQLKDARWSLFKNPADLTDRQADTLAALHATGGKVPRAWAMKELVRAIFAPGLTVAAVAELIGWLLARLSRSRLKPLVRLGRTIRKHRDGILAARRPPPAALDFRDLRRQRVLPVVGWA